MRQRTENNITFYLLKPGHEPIQFTETWEMRNLVTRTEPVCWFQKTVKMRSIINATTAAVFPRNRKRLREIMILSCHLKSSLCACIVTNFRFHQGLEKIYGVPMCVSLSKVNAGNNINGVKNKPLSAFGILAHVQYYGNRLDLKLSRKSVKIEFNLRRCAKDLTICN